jgi:hypothetical protein
MNTVAALASEAPEHYLVPPHYIPAEWPYIYELLEPAVERSGGRWSMSALLQSLCTGDHSLWITMKDGDRVAALVTQKAHYPHSTMLAIQFLGGTGFDEWGDGLLTSLEEFARSTNCNGVEAVGRFGFWPFFKKHNYNRAYCTYEKVFE